MNRIEKFKKLLGDNFFKAIIVILVLVLCYKIVTTEIFKTPLDFSNVNTSEVLSFFLALFAIALSIAFYFKASDTAHTFYDNTYKFTKEISEMLGRIEAGFGEKLRHLEESYLRMSKRIEGIPFGSSTEEKTSKELETLPSQIESAGENECPAAEPKSIPVNEDNSEAEEGK
jgi:hypothetical protein